MRETSKGGVIKVQDGRRGNEKMQLGWPETAAKEVRSQQLASNFSRLSLSHSLRPFLTLHPLLSVSRLLSALSSSLSSCTLIFVPDGTNLRIKRRCFMAGIHFHFRRRMIYLVALINATRDLANIYLVYIAADNGKKWIREFALIQFR